MISEGGSEAEQLRAVRTLELQTEGHEFNFSVTLLK